MFVFRLFFRSLQGRARRGSGLLALVLMLCTTVNVHANDVFNQLPENSLGFVVIRNVAAANAKIERFMQLVEIALPAPLAFVKYATGLDEGIDQRGDVLVALLPGTQNSSIGQPIVLLPVADYTRFAESIHGDTSGEICRVTIAGEDILVAEKNAYALLMNVEHRETLEQFLRSESKPIPKLQPLQSWLANTDIGITLMPTGVSKLFDMSRQAVAQQQENWAQEFGDPEFAEMLKEMQKSWAFYRWMLELLDEEIQVAALGVSIDEKTNVRISKRMLLESKSEPDSIETISSDDSLLAGYSAGPFVAVGGGTIAPGWTEWFVQFNRRITEEFSELEGYGDFEEEDWELLEQSYRTLYAGIRSTSFLMRPGSTKEPLFSNFFAASTVEDSAAYLESFKKYFELNNELMLRSSLGVDFQYEIAPVTIANGKGYEIVADPLAAFGGDNNVLFFDTVLKKTFGEDGKMRIYVIAADETHVVTGIQSRDQLASLIQDMRNNENGLQQEAELQTTARLLDPRASWKFYVSPQGTIQFLDRLLNEVVAEFGPVGIQLPDYPATPPIGFSLKIAYSVLEADLVFPVETLDGLARYVKKCKDEFDD